MDPLAEERDLVRRALGGDSAAFESLYRENVGRIHSLCSRMSGDRSRADDLTQEVFIRAYRQLGTFRGESRLGSWLHRMAVNVVLGDERSRARRFDLSRGAADADGLADPVSGRGREGTPDLERAIAALPAGAREVLVLHDIEGYRHEEIGEMTGRSAGTCRAQLHRARQLLREALK
ncbi:MAG: RNA polymerase sigma factor [Acidobacteria bacterium]|nr:RNA polymerase sigma factor [Acidobacteriota bacterium]